MHWSPGHFAGHFRGHITKWVIIHIPYELTTQLGREGRAVIEKHSNYNSLKYGGELVIYDWVTSSPRIQGLKTVNIISHSVGQEIRTGLAGWFQLRVSWNQGVGKGCSHWKAWLIHFQDDSLVWLLAEGLHSPLSISSWPRAAAFPRVSNSRERAAKKPQCLS